MREFMEDQYREWEAAVVARGLEVDSYVDAENGPCADDGDATAVDPETGEIYGDWGVVSEGPGGGVLYGGRLYATPEEYSASTLYYK